MPVDVGPHPFKPIRRTRLERLLGLRRWLDDRREACYVTRWGHPTRGWRRARPMGDRSRTRPS